MKRPEKTGRKSSRSSEDSSSEKSSRKPGFKDRADSAPRKRTSSGEGFSARRSSDRNPSSFERKDKPDSRSFNRDEKPTRSRREDTSGERKPYNREPAAEKPSRSRGGERSYGNPDDRMERPSESRGRGRSSENRDVRPGRSFDKPERRTTRPTRNDADGPVRERRSSDSSDKPVRRSFDKDERPKRSDSSSRVPYNREEKSKRSDSSSRVPYNREEKPKRSDSSSRVPYNREEKPKKSFDRDDRGSDRERENRFSKSDELPATKSKYTSRDEGDKKPFERKTTSDKPSYNREEKSSSSFPKKSFDDDKKPSRSFDKSEERPKKTFGKPIKKSATKAPDYFGEAKTGDEQIRLNRFISMAGICSRREADVMIEAGLFTVNGVVVTELGAKVNPTDDIRYNGERIRNEKNVYLLLNKPKDYITTMDDPEQRHTVMELVAKACKERIYPVGRLDRNTTGLLLFTNDGELAKILTHPSSSIRKIYHAELDKSFKVSDMKKLVEGVEIDEIGFIQVDDIAYDGDGSDKKQVGLEIHSGQNRVVRRMFEHLGYDVRKLDRVVFAGLTKKDLPRGRWRMLNVNEVAMLKMVTTKSPKKEKAN